MTALTLKNRFQGNSTLIENDFIDYYMIRANGEYVKVYLFLLRHLNDSSITLTISSIADALDTTERDVLRALKYWEKTGLVTMEYNDSGNVSCIGLEALPEMSSLTSATKASASCAPTKRFQETAVPSNTKPAKDRKELKQLLFVAEQYIGKTLTKTDVDTIAYFFDGLQFSTDLIEYLIEYCVDNGHKSMHYIKSVALSWADSRITTVEQAKLSSSAYNKNCYTVLKAFGIGGRGPAASELEYIRKWTDTYGFSLEVIALACDRTISSIHQPSFEYADSILTKWMGQEVHSPADVIRVDEAYQQEKKKKAPVVVKSSSANKFNNFQGRTYDIDSLEEQLLNSK
ncbi:MAG: DnaD domain protein [Lachnospiraceae bacterium]